MKCLSHTHFIRTHFTVFTAASVEHFSESCTEDARLFINFIQLKKFQIYVGNFAIEACYEMID